MAKSFIHITLAFSIFFSSGGLWISQHFCHKEHTGTSFFAILGTCCSSDTSPCMEDKAPLTCEHDEDDCCDDEFKFYKLDQDQLIAELKLRHFKLDISVPVLYAGPQFEFPVLDRSHLKYYTYVPPPNVFDRQVRLQTFLC